LGPRKKLKIKKIKLQKMRNTLATTLLACLLQLAGPKRYRRQPSGAGAVKSATRSAPACGGRGAGRLLRKNNKSSSTEQTKPRAWIPVTVNGHTETLRGPNPLIEAESYTGKAPLPKKKKKKQKKKPKKKNQNKIHEKFMRRCRSPNKDLPAVGGRKAP
jgi:hypothetical protein